MSLAQQPPEVWRIGFLSNGTVASANGQLDALVRGLNELGYVEGRSFVVESRWAEGKLDRLPTLVAELLAQKLDVVFAPSGVAVQTVKTSGATLPIVFAFAPDPVGQGFGSSLSRPGGNMTGLTSTHTELSAKRMELLREAFPATRRTACLFRRLGATTSASAGAAGPNAEQMGLGCPFRAGGSVCSGPAVALRWGRASPNPLRIFLRQGREIQPDQPNRDSPDWSVRVNRQIRAATALPVRRPREGALRGSSRGS